MITIKHLFYFILIASSAATTWCMESETSLKKQIACAHVLQGHTQRIYSIEYHPDGKQLISSAEDHTINTWDLSTQSVLHTTPHWGPISLSIDRGGKQYASSQFKPDPLRWAPSFIKVWNPDTNESKELHDHEYTIWSLAFHPLDSTKIASGSADKTIKIWDITHETCLATLEGHREGILSIAYSPDGTDLASGSHDGSIIVWNNGQKLRVLREELLFASVITIAYNPIDCNQLASGNSSDYFKIWDTRYGKSIFVKKPGYRPDRVPSIMSVTYKSDGTQVAYGKSDGTVTILDIRSRKILSTFNCNQDISSIKYHPGGKQIACGLDDGTIALWDVE